MPIYMTIDGIKGEVSESKHKEWIELGSMQLGVSRNISSNTGRASTSREASLPMISELVVTKSMDASSLDLFKWSLGGSEGKLVKIDLVAAGGKEATIYYQYELTNTLVSGYSTSAGGDGKPTESLSLNFTKIQEKYIPTDEKGKATGKQPVVIYDLATAKTG